jgi:hypothetical protein
MLTCTSVSIGGLPPLFDSRSCEAWNTRKRREKNRRENRGAAEPKFARSAAGRKSQEETRTAYRVELNGAGLEEENDGGAACKKTPQTSFSRSRLSASAIRVASHAGKDQYAGSHMRRHQHGAQNAQPSRATQAKRGIEEICRQTLTERKVSVHLPLLDFIVLFGEQVDRAHHRRSNCAQTDARETIKNMRQETDGNTRAAVSEKAVALQDARNAQPDVQRRTWQWKHGTQDERAAREDRRLPGTMMTDPNALLSISMI